MADLVIRNLKDEIVASLKQRAAQHKRSAEGEHRAILEDTLLKTRRKPLAEVLANMPNVGNDADFERSQGNGDVARVFDWHQCRQRSPQGFRAHWRFAA